MNYDMVECVNRGAKLLTEKMPDWQMKIDVNRLDMDSCQNCILGQLFSDNQPTPYTSGLIFLGIYDDDYDDMEHGFDCPRELRSDDNEYEKLTDCWLLAIIGAL